MLQSQDEQDRPRDHRQSRDNAADACTKTTGNERRQNDKAGSEKNAEGEHRHRHSLLEPRPKFSAWLLAGTTLPGALTTGKNT
jgi:type IV secretory pathway VirB10-like protein